MFRWLKLLAALVASLTLLAPAGSVAVAATHSGTVKKTNHTGHKSKPGTAKHKAHKNHKSHRTAKHRGHKRHKAHRTAKHRGHKAHKAHRAMAKPKNMKPGS
jgi:hypothetical protein